MKQKFIAALGMLVVLFLAYQMDYWLEAVKRTARSAFNQSMNNWLIWGSGLANLLFAGILLALAGYIYLKTKRSKLIAFVLIFGGIAATFSIGLWSIGFTWPFDPLPFVNGSHFTIAGAIITAIGFACLIPEEKNRSH